MTYVAPSTVAEVCELLASDTDSKVFAGATDVLPQAKAGRPLPGMLIDVKRIQRLSNIQRVDEGWLIGAAVPAAAIAGDSRLRAEYPGIAEAVALIGSDQIQNRATLGGNLCNASPAADSGPPMVVNDARAVIASPAGERSIPVRELTAAPGRTSLARDEFVVEFVLPNPEPSRSDAYLRFTPRAEMDIAVVGAAARVAVDANGLCVDARVALGAVAPTVVSVEGIAELLAGTALDERDLEKAAAVSREHCSAIDDKRGTKEYRRHLAGVLTERALKMASIRAREGR